MNFGALSWTSRNPLGVIALFIFLIYSACALVITNSLKHLTENNQNILVWFIVLFPLVVLGSFLWLVVKHHKKLYAPSDFRSDEGFLGTDSNPETLGPRLIEETAVELEGENQQPTENLAVHIPDLAGRAYLAEGLVFQELQREFQGAIRRELVLGNTKFGTTMVDGTIETSSGSYVVEVKLVSRRGNGLEQIKRGIIHLENTLRIAGTSRVKGLILAIVVERGVSVDQVEEWLETIDYSGVFVRVFQLSNMLEKYKLVAPTA